MLADESESKPNRPAISKFKQQKLPAYQPVMTPKPVIAFFFCVGVIFIPLGVLFFYTSNGLFDMTVRYDDKCASYNSSCVVNITVPVDIQPPVYFYYELTNYYQNHRRYVKSRDDTQLQGNIEPYATVSSTCDPIVSVNGSQAQQDVYFPCGLIAWSLFNDSFAMLGLGGSNVTLDDSSIAWPVDVSDKFHEPQLSGNMTPGAPIAQTGPLATFNITDQHFIVWMRTAALPDFRKLWAVIHSVVPAGSYELVVENNYDVSAFGGTKSVVLATTSWLGGKNPFLGIAYMAVGSVSIVLGFVFLVKQIVAPRKLGDTAYLRWR